MRDVDAIVYLCSVCREKLKVDRAKSADQLARNSVLRRVSDALKKDTRCALKEVSIEWILEDRNNKNREVRVGGIPCRQHPNRLDNFWPRLSASRCRKAEGDTSVLI